MTVQNSLLKNYNDHSSQGFKTTFLGKETISVRKTIVLMAVSALAALPCALSAQEHGLEDTMKQVGATMGKLKKGLDGKMLHDVAGDAEKMQALMKDAEQFFAHNNLADAVQMAKDAQSAAGTLVTAGHGNNAEAAGAAFSKLGGSCKGCHDAHREKLADGTYKMK